MNLSVTTVSSSMKCFSLWRVRACVVAACERGCVNLRPHQWIPKMILDEPNAFGHDDCCCAWSCVIAMRDDVFSLVQ